MKNEELKQTQEELVQVLFDQVGDVVHTLMKLRTPEKAYEIMRAVDNARQIMHWVADGYNYIQINKK
jgi:hypothetical protein